MAALVFYGGEVGFFDYCGGFCLRNCLCDFGSWCFCFWYFVLFWSFMDGIMNGVFCLVSVSSMFFFVNWVCVSLFLVGIVPPSTGGVLCWTLLIGVCPDL